MQTADTQCSAAAAAGEPDRRITGIISTSVSRIRCSLMPVCQVLWRSQRGLDADKEYRGFKSEAPYFQMMKIWGFLVQRFLFSDGSDIIDLIIF